jgi:hypothetical protein
MTTERKRQWSLDNKDKCRKYELKYRQNLRAEMILAYGKTCQDCGEGDPLVLVLDHINDDAKQERKENNHCGGFHMYSKLKKLGWPKDRHQLLCHNCNFRKEYRRRSAKSQ